MSDAENISEVRARFLEAADHYVTVVTKLISAGYAIDDICKMCRQDIVAMAGMASGKSDVYPFDEAVRIFSDSLFAAGVDVRVFAPHVGGEC